MTKIIPLIVAACSFWLSACSVSPEQQLSKVISPDQGSLSDKGLINTAPGRIEAEDYSAMYGILTEPCSEGGLNTGWANTGDWQYYTVDVSKTAKYNVEFRVATIVSDASFTCKVNSKDACSISVPNTGGWQTWTTVKTSLFLTKGRGTIGVAYPNSPLNMNWINLTLDPAYAENLPYQQYAKIFITVDDTFTAYLNGVQITEETTNNYAHNWRSGHVIDNIPLTSGENMLAIDCHNWGDITGLLAAIELKIPEFPTRVNYYTTANSPSYDRITTNVSNPDSLEWTKVNYNDTSWARPEIISSYTGYYYHDPVSGFEKLNPLTLKWVGQTNILYNHTVRYFFRFHFNANYQGSQLLSPNNSTTGYTDDVLTTGDNLLSANRRYLVYLSTDGSLKLYDYSLRKDIWTSGTSGKPATYAALQNDGNFVLYGKDGTAYWNTRTYKPTPVKTRLVMQDDGNLVLYDIDTSKALWSSR